MKYAKKYLRRLKEDLRELLGLLSIEELTQNKEVAKSKVAQILKDQGVTENGLESAIKEIRKGERVTSSSAEETYNSLNKYAKNLNELARTGKL